MSDIQIAIKEELKTLRTNHSHIFSDEVIDLFIKIIGQPITDPEVGLEGLQIRVPNAIRKILIENVNKEDQFSFFPEFAKIEPFFKKIIYLIDYPKFIQISTARSGLAKCIDYLGLNPSNIRLDSTSVESVINAPNFLSHILRSYKLRNIESHICKIWPLKDFYENVESILVVYLYTVYLHKEALNNIITPQFSYDSYLSTVVRSFQNWRERFIHITGIERFEEIPLHAIESEDWGANENVPLRTGKIDELRNNIDENAMIILGEPGMGKSTSMQYLAYKDSNELLGGTSDDGTRIPIYIELKMLSKGETLFDECCKKIGVTNAMLIDLFSTGRVTLFLDGLNEIFPENKIAIKQEIQSIINNYQNIFLLITSRPLTYSNEFKDVPVFNLQKLDDTQVQEFLIKNCSHERIRNIIMQEIFTNHRFGKIVRVPLMLKMLVNVTLHSGGNIPSNKTKIISEFIKNLYKRENEKHIYTVDLRIIHRLLCFLGHLTRDINASNVGWRIEEFESLIEDRIEKWQFRINVYEFIDMAVDLHILVKDADKFSFIHELYQEYFASEELFRLNTIKNVK